MMEALEAQGVEIIMVDDEVYDAEEIFKKCDVQKWEFKEAVEEYLARADLKGDFPRTLEEIYNGDKDEYMVIPHQYQHIKTTMRSDTKNASYNTALNNIEELKGHLTQTFTDNNLDAMIYPQQKNLVVKIGSRNQYGRNGILAAVTGSPVVTIPAGFSTPSEEAPLGVPIGMEILGRPWSEKKLLGIAYQVEKLTQVRKPPRLAEQVVEFQSFESVPSIVPDRGNVHAAYPFGTLETRVEEGWQGGKNEDPGLGKSRERDEL